MTNAQVWVFVWGMKLLHVNSSTPSDMAALAFEIAADGLASSQRGANALRALASVCDDFTSLDSDNQARVLYLVAAVFSHPGTGRDVIKDRASTAY